MASRGPVRGRLAASPQPSGLTEGGIAIARGAVENADAWVTDLDLIGPEGGFSIRSLRGELNVQSRREPLSQVLRD